MIYFFILYFALFHVCKAYILFLSFISFRFEPANVEYEEDLTLKVSYSKFRCGKQNILFSTRIQGKKRYNSWFKFEFNKDIFIPKGIKCCIEIAPKQGATFQKISKLQVVKDPIIKECQFTKMHQTPKDIKLYTCDEPQNYIVKSLHLEPIH